MKKYLSIVVVFFMGGTAAFAQERGKEWADQMTFETYPYPIYPLREKPPVFTKVVSERIIFSDNVFQKDDKESDTILSTAFQVGGSTSRPNFDANLSALINYDKYLSNSELDGEEFRLFGQARSAGKAHFYGGSLQFKREREPFDLLSLDQVQRQEILLGIFGGFTVSSRMMLEPDLRITKTDFVESEFERADNTTNIITLPLIYNLSQKQDLLAEIAYEMLDYTEDLAADSTAIAFRIGARGALTPRLKSLIKLGTQKRSSDANPLTGESHDKNVLNLLSLFTYEMDKVTEAEINLSQSSGYSISGDFDVQSVLSFRVKKEFSPYLKGTASIFTAKNDAFIGVDRNNRGLSIVLTYQFRKNLTFEGGISNSFYGGSGDIEKASVTQFFIGAGLSF
ncbi:MAG: hypothetical protein HY606_01725 [Planctomycetes bacterium]|nr:hypothetical protein [Planctomycetota bacterium]